jgi:DUF4097 and DUF4098 domain-containing protein YvlB
MTRAAVLIVPASLALLCSCDDIVQFGHVQQDFHYSYAMQPGGHLDVENRNGGVSIIGWDRNSIDVAGSKYAGNESELPQVRIKVDVNGNAATIVTESPDWGNYGANYTIRVPRNTAVSRAKSTNGNVTVEDLTSGGSLVSTNGRMTLHRDDGDFDVRTTNGSVEYEDCAGTERAETTNGSVKGTLKSGSFEAHTTNGSIDLSLDNPARGQQLRAQTTNGSIQIALNQFLDNPIHAQTSHGGLTLRLPHNTDAHLDAHTSLARISSELPISAEESDKHELHGNLGRGGPVISVSTSTGAIRIEDGGH